MQRGRRGRLGDPPVPRAPTEPARVAPGAVEDEDRGRSLAVEEAARRSSERPGFRDRLGKARGRARACPSASGAAPASTTRPGTSSRRRCIRADVGVGRHHRAARRPARPGQGRGDHRGRRSSLDALKVEMKERLAGVDRDLHFEPPGGPRTCGCSSASTAWARPPRSARSAAPQVRRRPHRGHGRRRHVPRRRRRAARAPGPSGPAPTSCAAARAATPARSSSTPSQRAARPRRRPRAGRHRRPPPHQDQPHGGAAQGAPGRRQGRRARSPRCSSCSTPPPARTA